jgi:hypothetical protein
MWKGWALANHESPAISLKPVDPAFRQTARRHRHRGHLPPGLRAVRQRRHRPPDRRPASPYDVDLGRPVGSPALVSRSTQ